MSTTINVTDMKHSRMFYRTLFDMKLPKPEGQSSISFTALGKDLIIQEVQVETGAVDVIAGIDTGLRFSCASVAELDAFCDRLAGKIIAARLSENEAKIYDPDNNIVWFVVSV